MAHAGGVEGVDRGQACAALALAAVIAVEQVLAGCDLAEIALGRRRRLRLPARVEVVGRTARLGARRPQRLGDAGALAGLVEGLARPPVRIGQVRQRRRRPRAGRVRLQGRIRLPGDGLRPDVLRDGQERQPEEDEKGGSHGKLPNAEPAMRRATVPFRSWSAQRGRAGGVLRGGAEAGSPTAPCCRGRTVRAGRGLRREDWAALRPVAGVVGDLHRADQPDLDPEPLHRDHRRRVADRAIGDGGLDRQDVQCG